MAIIFDDSAGAESLYPFTATRSAADIRIGILTIREKWDLMSEKIGSATPTKKIVSANLVPTLQYAAAILNGVQNADESDAYRELTYPWQIFEYNNWALLQDYELVTGGRQTAPLPASNKVIGRNIFLEPGAIVEHSILNTSTGPIYIGKNATVQEGCMIRGPFSLGEGAVLKMGSKVYGATTIGPYCVVAGEIKNAVLFGFTNKAHDGYLGDSVIGEWCNLGAGTINSNVLNTAGNVKVWCHSEHKFVRVGLKCGLLMGDYSRSAINTSFNTGTVVGVGCNIFHRDFPPKFVPDFTWGMERYIFEKMLQDIGNWKNLKGHQLTDRETTILEHLYNKN